MGSSELINFRTAINYIAKMSGLPTSLVQKWYSTYSTNASNALNVRTAFKICNKMLNIGFNVSRSLPANLNIQNACSFNTFKAIYTKVLGTLKWNIVAGISQVEYNKDYKALAPMSFSMNIIGGGGGGSGAVAGYSAKNAPHDVYGSIGGAGGASYVYVNNVVKATASGGSATGYSYVRANANNGWRYANGINGNSGKTSSISLDLKIGDSFKVVAGAGGGGGGGVSGHRGDVGQGSAGANPNGANGGRPKNIGSGDQRTYGGHGGGVINGTGSGGINTGNNTYNGTSTNNSSQLRIGQFASGASRGNPNGNSSAGIGGGGRGGDNNGQVDGGTGGNSGGCTINHGGTSYFNKIS